jgi:TonB family protein
MDVDFLKHPPSERFLIMVGVSLGLHLALIIFLSLNPLPTIIKVSPLAYTVTLMPVSIPEPEIQKPPLPKEEPPKIIEKKKPVEKPKKDDIVEKVKKKEIDKETLKHIQEAMEEIQKKVALDKIEKKVARREERVEERTNVSLPKTPPQSPPKQPGKLEELYSSIVQAKILDAWTIPENFFKEMVDLETIIVVIIERDGRIQQWWFEKKSGHAFYDQSTVRALKKAEPFPPIPKELNKNTIEFGFRFTPDLIR